MSAMTEVDKYVTVIEKDFLLFYTFAFYLISSYYLLIISFDLSSLNSILSVTFLVGCVFHLSPSLQDCKH